MSTSTLAWVVTFTHTCVCARIFFVSAAFTDEELFFGGGTLFPFRRARRVTVCVKCGVLAFRTIEMVEPSSHSTRQSFGRMVSTNLPLNSALKMHGAARLSPTLKSSVRRNDSSSTCKLARPSHTYAIPVGVAYVRSCPVVCDLCHFVHHDGFENKVGPRFSVQNCQALDRKRIPIRALTL